MIALLMLIASVWLLGAVVLVLHRASAQIGQMPLWMMMGGLVMLIGSQWGIYVQPFADFPLHINSSVLVPNVLMIVLVMYLSSGASAARVMIFSLIGIAIVGVIWFYANQMYLSLPDAGSSAGLTTANFVLRPRALLASLIAFAVDLFLIVLVYQGLKNTNRLPEWGVIALALLVTLWGDAILFRLIANLGTADFPAALPKDLLNKTIAGVILAPLMILYLMRIAPLMSVANRRVLDILRGTDR